MAQPRRGVRVLALAIVGVSLVLGLGAAVFWDDLMRTALDPRTPFQTYRPPPPPDYSQRSAWHLMPTTPAAATSDQPPADVFFVGPTTYNGGKNWNAPVSSALANETFRSVMAPNYAGPFVRVGRIFAPRYRQASLYTQLTLREDAREARKFAYGDVARAFDYYLAHDNGGRPFVIVGVEQGGTLAARLLSEKVAPDEALRDRLAAAYLIATVTPADRPPIPPCIQRGQTGCVASWVEVFTDESDRAQLILDRALVWNGGELENLRGRAALCFNPLLGATTNEFAPARLHQGAANATGLEWGARPAFLARQVSAQCKGGVLQVSPTRSASLQRTDSSWTDRRKVPGYNLFYLDLETDALARVSALTGR